MSKLVNVLMSLFVEAWRRGGVETFASLVRGGVMPDSILTNARSACLNALTYKRKK
jgi:hypothetical protein